MGQAPSLPATIRRLKAQDTNGVPAKAAADLMAQHLRMIERSHQLGNKTGGAVDVADLFKRTWQALACSKRSGRTRHRPG